VRVDSETRRTAAAIETVLAGDAAALGRTLAAARKPEGAAVAAAAAAAHTIHAARLLHGLPEGAPARTSGAPPPTPSAGAAMSAAASTRIGLALAQQAAASGYLRQLRPLAPSTASLLASVAGSDSAFAALLRSTPG
jgi:hypothetical protein